MMNERLNRQAFGPAGSYMFNHMPQQWNHWATTPWRGDLQIGGTPINGLYATEAEAWAAANDANGQNLDGQMTVKFIPQGTKMELPSGEVVVHGPDPGTGDYFDARLHLPGQP
jgi:hypothetical protein